MTSPALLKFLIQFLNDGSDNPEYKRGQIELALYLLGATYDDTELVKELSDEA